MMVRRRQPGFRLERRKGAELVEAALILPLFLIFWFGIVDWSIAFFVHQTVAYRTNSAIRWAVTNDYDPTKIRAMVLYGNPNSTAAGAPWWDVGHNVNVAVSNPDAGIPSRERIVITVSNYQWMHFTPFFAGPYIARPITVSLPVEDKHTGL